jgi:tripartite motif-containing protein 71
MKHPRWWQRNPRSGRTASRCVALVSVTAATTAMGLIGAPAADATAPPYHYVSTILGPGTASMYPVDVTATSTYYYVIDAGNYRVVAVNRSTGNVDYQSVGTQGGGPGQIGDARAIAVDPSGNVWVADTANSRVEEFSPTLTFENQFGSKGKGPGQFSGLDYGIAVGQGIGSGGTTAEVVYVVDGAGYVDKFDLSGDYLGQFGGPSLLKEPRQVTVDPATDDVFVVDARHDQVDVFSDAGTLLYSFGSAGTGDGQFSGDPRGISIYDSTVFVTDSGGHRVEAFNKSTGAYEFSIGGPSVFTGPRGLVATSDGYLLITDEWGFGLHEYTTSGTFVENLFGTPPPTEGVNTPRGLAVTLTGRLSVSDYWNMRVETVNSDGSDPVDFGFRSGQYTPGSINFAWANAIQPSTGDVFVANRESNDIVVFSSAGTFITQWGKHGSAPGDFTFPQGIAFAPDGNLIVADSGNSRLEAFSINSASQGTLVAVYGQSGTAAQGPGYLNTPTGVSVASDGTIWVADTLNSSVQSLSPSGTWTRFQTPTGGPRIGLAWGVQVGPDGNIWIAESSLNRIAEMTPAGVSIFSADGQALGAGPLDGPSDIAFGPQGQVWVSDTWNNRVITLES